MDNFLSVIEAWTSVYNSALRTLTYENELLETLKKNEAKKPFAEESIKNQQRKVRALMYVCERIQMEARLEGVNGKGVEYIENKNREDGNDNVQTIESGEAATD